MNQYTTFDTLMSAQEVSETLKISRRTLSRWTRLRRGPPRIKIGRSVYYRQKSVFKWLAELEESGVAMP